MTTQTSQALIQQPYKNRFGRLWNTLIEPADGVVGDDRRRASSLSALTLVFIPLATLAVVLGSTSDLLVGETASISIGGLVGITLVIFSYFISRTRYFQIAAYITSIVPIIAVSLALKDAGVGVSESALPYLTLTVILSSLLLKSRDTIIAGFLVIFSILVLFSAHSAP